MTNLLGRLPWTISVTVLRKRELWDIGLVNRHGVGLRAVVTIPLDENQEMKGETDETEDVFSNVTVQLARQHGAS